MVRRLWVRRRLVRQRPGQWPLAAMAALALAACQAEPAQDGQAAELPPGDRLTLTMQSIPDLKNVSGEIATQDHAEALARIPGTLVSLDVRAGDRVQKGQRIARIADARIGHEASAMAAQVAAAQAEAERSRADLVRIKDLHSHGVYAKARLEQAEAAAQAAEAQLKAARARQQASHSVVEQGLVLAPASGTVLRADIPAGSVVNPGMSIATITAGVPILRLWLPEAAASRVQTGAQVVIRDPEARLAGEDRQVRLGRVIKVYPVVDAGQVRIDASLSGLGSGLVGRRISAAVEIGQRPALIVPQKFISTRYGLDQVRLVGGDNRLSLMTVQTAPTADPDMVEILSGVRAGDTLFRPDGAAQQAVRP